MPEIPQNQYSEERAINEAINLQHVLYGNKTPYLRTVKGFRHGDYKEAEIDEKERIRIINIILNLPKTQPERGRKIFELINNESLAAVCSIWENLESHFEESKEYTKFAELAYLIFDVTDREFEGHRTTKEQGGYYYETPSIFYMPLVFALYQRISGKSYSTAEELKENFINGIKGKKILELASGPGWFLHLLKSYGADVAGIEANTEPLYSKNYNELNIKNGNALNISEYPTAQFDIITTNNFLNTSCLTPEQEVAIIKNILQKLKPKGVSVNSTQDYKESFELRILKAVQKYGKTDPIGASNSLKFLTNPEFKGEILIKEEDKPTIPESILRNVGFKNFATYHENGYFVFSFEK